MYTFIIIIILNFKMSKLCEGFPNTETQKVLQWALVAVGLLTSSTTLLTSIYLYRKPGAFKAVPLFVTLQMVALLMCIPFDLTYYTIIVKDIDTANEISQ